MPDALQSILTDAGLAIAPIRAVKTPDQAAAFFKQLGYTLPSGAFGSALNGLAAQASGLVATVGQLVAASSDAAVVTALADLFTKLVGTVNAIEQLHAQIQSSAPGTPNIADLPRRLTDFLILDYLDRQRP